MLVVTMLDLDWIDTVNFGEKADSLLNINITPGREWSTYLFTATQLHLHCILVRKRKGKGDLKRREPRLKIE